MKILIYFIVITLLGILVAMPLYLLVNIFCWVFNISFHLTMFKAFILCILIGIVRIFIFKTVKLEIKSIEDEENKEGE